MPKINYDDFSHFLVNSPDHEQVFERIAEAKAEYNRQVAEVKEAQEGWVELLARLEPDDDWMELASCSFELEDNEDEEPEDDGDDEEDDEEEDQ